MTHKLQHYLDKEKINQNDIRGINNNPELIEEIYTTTPNCTSDRITERLYWLRNNLLDYPSCKHCEKSLNSNGFLNGLRGYRDFCSRKCSRNSTEYLEKVTATSLEKYGVDHPWKSNDIQEKRQVTNLGKYGDENFMRWNGDIFKESMIAKYGAWSTRHVKEINEKIISSINKKNESLFAQKIIDLCDDLMIIPKHPEKIDLLDRTTEYKWMHTPCSTVFSHKLKDLWRIRCPLCDQSGISNLQHSIEMFVSGIRPDLTIKRNDRSLIHPYEIDILIPELKLAIEVNGDYWHSDTYVSDDYHIKKCEMVESTGFQLIQIFESTWNTRRDIIESLLIAKLGRAERFYARKLQIEQVSAQEASEFLNRCHRQGSSTSSIRLGLRQNGKLVSLMTFGKPRFARKYDWELIRYCSELNTVVVGGAGKLLKAFEKIHQGSIISYADRLYSNGNLYDTLGFKMVRTTAANYRYVNFKTGQSYSRYEAQKGKLKHLLGDENFFETLTEVENMHYNGFLKVTNAGNLVYEK